MKSFILKRLVQFFPVVIGVVSLVFVMAHLIPGDPIEMMLGDSSRPEDRIQLRAQLGLDLPLPLQYVKFWKQTLNGTWGVSIAHERTVLPLVMERFFPTLLLSCSSLLVALALSLPLGVWAARRAGRWQDMLAMIIALLGGSIPIMLLAPLMILLFSITLQWYPVAGYGTFRHLVLPSVCLGITLTGLLSRMLRTSMIDVLGENYIIAARARGVSEMTILWRHALKNTAIPVLAILANLMGGILAGAVLTETLFDWPGIGKLLYSAFQSRDYPLVQGCVMWISLSYLSISLLADLLYALVDPRVRYQETL